MKLKHIFYLYLVVALGIISSCETMPDPKTERTATAPMNGEWWVKVYVDIDSDTPGNQLEEISGGYYQLLTYNTASNRPDSLWFNFSVENFPVFFKTAINLTNNTLFVENSQNLYLLDDTETPENESELVTLTNGKIIMGGVITANKNLTDSIYCETEFTTDPGFKYIFAGYRRTQFKEDDH